MANLPINIKDQRLVYSLGPYLVSQGKVRDTYTSPLDSNQLLIVATDRISIFDFVLPATVPHKGEVLTALTHFWLTQVIRGVVHHLIQGPSGEEAVGRAETCMSIYQEIPRRRTMVVHKLKILPFELIFRAHLGGSVWKQYEQTGTVAGVELRSGLTKWQQLEEPLFTPSTKSEHGHDLNITQAKYFAEAGEVGRQAEALARSAYTQAYQYAMNRGIAILDTKFEVGLDEQGQVVLADEVLTPDSSRFTTVDNLVEALRERRDPVFYDKEPVRTWGRGVDTPFQKVGINNLDPGAGNQVTFVHSLTVPKEILEQCTARYLDIFNRLTGTDLGSYQTQNLL